MRHLFIFLGVLPLLFTASCATPPPPAPAAAVTFPAKRGEPPRAKREPGSLWSEDSTWNDVYNETPARVVGDILTVKLSDSARARIVVKAEKPKTDKPAEKPPETASKDGKPVTPPPPAPAAGGDALAAKPPPPEAPKILHATIKEILPRGVFVINASETVRVGDQEPRVFLDGRVRDRDIDGEDSVMSDAVQNMTLKVETDPKRITANEAEDYAAKGRQ